MKAVIASAIARREKAERLKKEFIEIARTGTPLTQISIVAPRTYQSWRKKDPEFDAVIKAILAKRIADNAERQLERNNEARLGKPRKRLSQAKPVTYASPRAIFQDPTYAHASKLINRYITPDIRESAISELMLMMLSGEEPDAGLAVRNARAEFSQLVGFEADLYSESVWDYGA